MAFDLFADRDLTEIAQCIRIPATEYPAAAIELQTTLPNDIPWMFTGGIENHPALIDAISRQRQLLGSTSVQISKVRDRCILGMIAAAAGWYIPNPVPNLGSNCNGPKQVIFRPANHCGGFGTRLVPSRTNSGSCESRDSDVGRNSRTSIDVPDGTWEEYVPGQSYSAAFVADGSHAKLLGVTRQILARDLHAHPLRQSHPFAYVGSVGPVPLDEAQYWSWHRLGAQILATAPLAGVFGVDAVRDATGDRRTLIEINPRYTASMELLERAGGQSIVDAHVSACCDAAVNDGPFAAQVQSPATELDRHRFHAKQIIFAPCEIHVSLELSQAIDEVRKPIGVPHPPISDIPQCGQIIPRGRPVVTVFGEGMDLDDATQQVQQRAEFVTDLVTIAAR